MGSAAVDDIIISLGWWGSYQKKQFVSLFPPLLVVSFHIMSIIFIGRAAEHKCAPLSRDFLHQLSFDKANLSSAFSSVTQLLNSTTITYHECSVDIKDQSGNIVWTAECPNGYDYSEPRDRTIVSEWDLVCNKEALSDLTQTVFALGMAAGASIFTSMADRFGRKPIYMAAHAIHVVSVIITAVASNFLAFVSVRFFSGAAQQGVVLVSWVMLIELLPTKYRALGSQVTTIVWPMGLLNMGFIAWLTRDLSWRTMQLISLVLSSYVLIQWWISDESLRWLIANNRTQDAEQIIRKAVKQNKVPTAGVLDVLQSVLYEQHGAIKLKNSHNMEHAGSHTESALIENVEEQTQVQAVEQVGLLGALKNKYVLKVIAVSAYMWFAASATYYGLIMTSGTLVDDIYLGYTLNILVEIPAGIVYILLINKMSRRLNVVVYHSVTGLSLLFAVCLTTIPAIQYPLMFGAQIVINTCLGISSLAARVGAMVAPFSRTLGRHLPWLPGLVFSILCLLITGMTWLLPETLNKELPQTVADMEKLRERGSKPKAVNSDY